MGFSENETYQELLYQFFKGPAGTSLIDLKLKLIQNQLLPQNPNVRVKECSLNSEHISVVFQLTRWLNERSRHIPFAVRMIWRETRGHLSSCYFVQLKLLTEMTP